MEQKGWLGADWGYTDRNREAKFYKLTAAGRRQLTAELSKWSRYTEAVSLVITAEGATALWPPSTITVPPEPSAFFAESVPEF